MTATAWYSPQTPTEAFDNISRTSNGSNGWTFPGYGSTFVSCSSLSNQAEITAVWEGQLSIRSVDLQAYASQAVSETYTVCGTTDGGSTWSQIGQASEMVSSSYTNLSIPVTSGSYDGLEVFAVSGLSWIGIAQVTVNG